MGLFSGLKQIGLGIVGGGIGFALGGPAGAKVGAGLGSSIGASLDAKDAAKKERKRALGDSALQFARLRDAAVTGGFNPLTALVATGGQGFQRFPTGVPPLASAPLLSGTVNSFLDELTGERLRRDNAQAVQDELARIELEQLKAGGAPGRGVRSADRSAVVVGVGNPIGPGPVRATGGLTFDKRLEGQVGVNVGAVNQTFTLKNGREVTVPVGPGLDEVVSGAVISAAPFFERSFDVGKWMMRSIVPPTRTPVVKPAARFQGVAGGFGKFFIPDFLRLQ